MATCFVIQPFDGGRFDKRYEDILEPAIKGANLEPYRVDRDPGASVLIEEIEGGIRSAQVCLADISTDNPNVWFELGFAIASQKDVVLICSEERKTRFPFDVQHRSITKYSTDSSRDFDVLREAITIRLKAILKKELELGRALRSTPIADIEGLSQHETVGLVAIAENINSPDDVVSTHIVRQEMSKAGFTAIAATLALTGLLAKDMIEVKEEEDTFHHETYKVNRLTSKGMDWLMSNQSRFILKEATSTQPVEPDDIPF